MSGDTTEQCALIHYPKLLTYPWLLAIRAKFRLRVGVGVGVGVGVAAGVRVRVRVGFAFSSLGSNVTD